MEEIYLFLLLLIVQNANSTEADTVESKYKERLKPCTNIKYSPDITSCMMRVAEKTKKEYDREFEIYLKLTKIEAQKKYNWNELENMITTAKNGWEIYIGNECLTEASVYEKYSYAYNFDYSECLIEKYNLRIDDYKNNKF